jgi:hypothetical protein
MGRAESGKAFASLYARLLILMLYVDMVSWPEANYISRGLSAARFRSCSFLARVTLPSHPDPFAPPVSLKIKLTHDSIFFVSLGTYLAPSVVSLTTIE